MTRQCTVYIRTQLPAISVLIKCSICLDHQTLMRKLRMNGSRKRSTHMTHSHIVASFEPHEFCAVPRRPVLLFERRIRVKAPCNISSLSLPFGGGSCISDSWSRSMDKHTWDPIGNGTCCDRGGGLATYCVRSDRVQTHVFLARCEVQPYVVPATKM